MAEEAEKQTYDQGLRVLSDQELKELLKSVDDADREIQIFWTEAQIWGRRGEICASGAPNDFSRPSETPNAPTH